MEISISSNSITGDYIDTKFGTCHDSFAVVPCAKFCSDPCISIWMRAKWNFHHIWIVMEKLLVKWAPGPQLFKVSWYPILPVTSTNPKPGLPCLWVMSRAPWWEVINIILHIPHTKHTSGCNHIAYACWNPGYWIMGHDTWSLKREWFSMEELLVHLSSSYHRTLYWWLSTKLWYHQTSNISGTSVGNKIVDHSDVAGASPVGAAPTTSSFSA